MAVKGTFSSKSAFLKVWQGQHDPNHGVTHLVSAISSYLHFRTASHSGFHRMECIVEEELAKTKDHTSN